ncbi:MAG: Ig-like domain repeat protein [Myxococcaceae bacterium]|nr:Ig-like domain repeat protein [Myxococcaceae bacterium]
MLTWLALVCGGLGCSQSEGLEAVEARESEGGWVAVGRPLELRGDGSQLASPGVTEPRVSRLQPPARAPAVQAWREEPSEEHALLLARAYFFELVGGPEPEAQRVPVNPETALRVRLPATESGEVEVATRGYVFRARPRVASGGAAAKPSAGATFYGARHLWTVGAQGLEQEGLWLTQRAEEFVVMEGGGAPYRASYEVEVPEGIRVVRDAGEYLEFLDRSDVPVVRLHYAVARDAAGRSRQGQVRLWGARPEGRGGPGNLPRLALERRTLKVEMEVGLEGLEGPVVVDPGWSATGSMAQARYRPTSTLLPNGKVLVAGGDREGGWGVTIASVELYDSATGTWSSAGNLASAREYHTATLLPDGRVLISGGMTTGRSVIASTELYDPATGTWSLGAPMANARCAHTSTLLNSGKVLVAGGGDCNGGTPLTKAELYDPATGTWSATGTLVRGVNSHTATLLNNGKVLVAGGYTLTTAAQLYDPATGTWSATGPMANYRSSHTATLLPNGKVLVTGGNIGSGISTSTASSELYDPTTGTWSATGSLNRSHAYHSAALLPNGKVLVGCGYSYENSGGGASLVSPELYEPATGTWSATSPMAVNTYDYAMTLLVDGSVLVAGGYSGPTARAELYSSVTGTWSTTGSLTAARSSHTTTLLPGGKVLVAGGQGASGMLSSAELYDPAAGSWSATGALGTARAHHTATLLPSGKVLVTGGDGASGPLTGAELYDPAAGTWSTTAALATARTRHTATLLPGGRVLVAGGSGASGPLLSAELYAPTLGTWSSTGSLATARSGHTATLLNTGKVLVAGGQSSSGPLSSAELYDPAVGTFSGTGALSTARADHTATLLPTGKVLLTGGSGSSGAVASAELYDPMAGTFGAAGSLATARTRHLALALPSGRVLVAAGVGTAGRVASAEVYEPSLGTFSASGSLGAARADFSGTPLPGGKVLAVGGSVAIGALASAEVFEDTGALEAWRPVVTPPASLQSGWTLTVNGSGLRGISEANGGDSENSATNFPLVSLVALEGGRRTPVSVLGFSNTSVTMRVPPVLDGYYLMNVTTNAIPGGAVVFVDGPPPAPALTAPAAFVNTTTPTISGTAEPGATVTISLDGAVAGTVTASASGAWSFTPSSPLGQGPYTATATATDAAGNTSASSAPLVFTVDTLAPAAPVLTGPAAVINTVTPTIAGTAEARSTVTVMVDGTGVGTATADASGAWSLTATTPVTQGSHTATATARDAAGNVGAASTPRSFVVDSVAPLAPGITAPAATVNTTLPTFAGQAEAGSSVTLKVDGSVLGMATANASGAWSFTASSPLAQGAHTATATASDAAGNTSAPSAPRSFTVDTVAPNAPVISAPASVVNTSTLTVSGTTEPGATVTISLDGTVVGTVTASASGAWSLALSSPLAEGAHAVTAIAADAAGNTGPSSTPRNFTVDTVAPAAPVLTAPAAVVNTTRPGFAGTAEAGSTVTVKLDGSTLGTATANASGAWSFTPTSSISVGAHTATATATDAAGNTSAPSAPRSFTVDTSDTVPPAAPVITGPTSLVNTSTPVITGSAEPGSTVTVMVDGLTVGTRSVPSSGSFSLTVSFPLSQGTHSARATARRSSGNSSPLSEPISFVVDSMAPMPPEVVTPAEGATAQPGELLFGGVAEPRSTVTVLVDGIVVGTAIADPEGVWTVSSLLEAQGQHALTTTATDVAGNVSQPSTARTFKVESPSCGCASSPTGGMASLLGLWALWLWGRRGRRASP